MPRAGSHTRHLTIVERQRVRMLHFDAYYSPAQIAAITGYTVSQIKYTCHAASAAVAIRSGRPAVLDEDEPVVKLSSGCIVHHVILFHPGSAKK